MNKPQKVLVFIDWYFPAFKAGGPIRSVNNLINQLNQDFLFYIVTSDRDYGEKHTLSKIKFNEWVKREECSVVYLTPENQNIGRYTTIIDEIQPHLLYLNSVFSYRFSILPILAAKYKNCPIILAPRGMLSPGSLGVKSTKKRTFLFISKLIGLFHRIKFHVTTSHELVDTKRIFPQNKISLANNFANPNFQEHQWKKKKMDQLKVVTLARISAEKNIHFGLDILKKCTEFKIDYTLIGPISNEAYWKLCKEKIDQLPQNIQFNYFGVAKPEDLSKLLLAAHVMFLPTTGENFGHAIIEAMNFSCIPIISDKTQWRELKSKNVGFDIALSNKEKFVQSLQEVNSLSEKEFNEMSNAANRFAKDVIFSEKLREKYINQVFNLSTNQHIE